MLRSTKEVIGYRLLATDGPVGKCKDMLFDDRLWTIRYIVVDTGNWLPGRLVIISTSQLGEPVWQERSIPVSLNAKQIEEAPPLGSEEPVSRRYERLFLQKFGQPLYWMAAMDPSSAPAISYGAHLDPYSRAVAVSGDDGGEDEERETHLRSINEVCGYGIHATDDEIGKVDDFVVEDDTWGIRYLVVDTRKWLPGGQVLIAADWMRRVSWADREVVVGLPSDLIKESPKYNPSEPVNREYEARLYDFYGRPHYWLER